MTDLIRQAYAAVLIVWSVTLGLLPHAAAQTPNSPNPNFQQPVAQAPNPRISPPQPVETQSLDQAVAVDQGLLTPESGGLVKSLWQGTSASVATRLLSEAPDHRSHPVARDLVRAVVLSGGIPPQSDDTDTVEDFRDTRLAALMRLGDMRAVQEMISLNTDLSGDPVMAANMALIAGDGDRACEIADAREDARAAPNWIKLRAFCHVLRDEIPAAELLTQLLSNMNAEDPAYYALMARLTGSTRPLGDTPIPFTALNVAMMTEADLPWPDGHTPSVVSARRAMNRALPGQTRLDALYNAGPSLSDRQLGGILRELGDSQAAFEDTLGGLAGGGAISLTEALDLPMPQGTGQLYIIAIDGDTSDRPKAMATLLERADKADAFDRFAALLAPQISLISPEIQAQNGEDLFIRAALQRRDIPALQSFYRRQKPGADKYARLALATDALGFGFLGGNLGNDIQARLKSNNQKIRAQAVRDTSVAVALGARLSGAALEALETGRETENENASASTIARLALRHAARNGSQAETALRAAHILDNQSNDRAPLDDLTLFMVIESLQTVGLAPYASQVAALEFWGAL